MPICLTPTYDIRRKPQTPGACRVNWPNPLTRGLVGLWLLNENGGGRCYDLAGLNRGTFGATAPTRTSGRCGRGLQFSNAYAVVNCGNASPLVITGNQVSLFCLFNAGSWNTGFNYDYLCGREGSASPYWNYGLRVYDTQMDWVIASGATEYKLQIPNPSTNVDHMLVGTYNGTTQALYLDGVLAGSRSTSGNLYNPSGADFTIGDSDAFTGRAADDAKIFAAGVYNRGLSAAEVRTLTRELYSLISPPQTHRTWVNATAAAGGGGAFGTSIQQRHSMRSGGYRPAPFRPGLAR